MYPSTGGFGGGGFTHPGQQPQGERGIERRFIGKIWKAYFSGEVIFGGQNPKNEKKFSKNFIVPNRSLGHTDHLYTYKGHIEHVGFT